MQPLVLITEPIDPACKSWLAERCEVIDAPLDSPPLGQHLPRAEGVVVRTYTQVNKAFLDSAPNLRVVARAGVGLDNIDLQDCAERGVSVVHTPGANTDAVVEYTIALMLDALRPRPSLTEPLAKDEWGALRKASIAPRQLLGSTIGILGMGRVGTRIANLAAAFGSTVIYNDIADVPAPPGATSVSAEELFERADILTVHIDNRPSNARFIAADLINRMREDAVFINASRGFVVDHAALAEFLSNNPRALAALDVHDPEPITESNPLLPLENARLLPHIGAATAEAHRNMSWVVRDVWRVFSGESPEHPASPTPA